MEDIISARIQIKDFEWASRKFTPSGYFVRGEIKEPHEVKKLVLYSDHLWFSINQTVKKNDKSEDEVYESAQKILTELGHDFQLCSVRWFGIALAKLSKSLYNGIQVHANMISEVRQAYVKYPVILLPTHRSYVDFLLISYVSFHYDLALPIIAAGIDFMGMTGVGELLRKSGAFYIRRTFGEDALYWSVVSEYVRKALLVGGHPLEMFVEGTRSRSGKSLHPKFGLLSAMLELARSREVPDILILPVAISYDRTLEETLYAHELLGKPKLRESTHGLVKALMWLGSQSYGSIYVNFGEPLSFRSILKETEAVHTSSPTSGRCFNLGHGSKHSPFTKAVKRAAEAAVLCHQECLRVPLMSAISLILLSIISRGNCQTRFSVLVSVLQQFRILLQSVNSDFAIPLREDSLWANTRHIIGVHSNLVQCENELVTIKHCTDESIPHMKLQHYANQILPKLLPFCILSLFRKLRIPEGQDSAMNGDTTTNSISKEYVFVRRLLAPDFVFAKQSELSEIKPALLVLQNLTVSVPEEFDYISDVLRHGVESYLIGYWGVMKIFRSPNQRLPDADVTHKSFEMKHIGILAQTLLLEQMKTSLPKQYGALSMETICNACLSLVAMGAVEKLRLTSNGIGLRVTDKKLLLKTTGHVELLIGASVGNLNWSHMDSLACSKI